MDEYQLMENGWRRQNAPRLDRPNPDDPGHAAEHAARWPDPIERLERLTARTYDQVIASGASLTSTPSRRQVGMTLLAAAQRGLIPALAELEQKR